MNTYNLQEVQRLNNIRNKIGDSIIEKIEKLIALGEKNSNSNEAQSALKKVGELCSKHNVDLSDVRMLIEFKNKKIDISKLASKMAYESQRKETNRTYEKQKQNKVKYEQTKVNHEDFLRKYKEEILKNKQKSQEYYHRKNPEMKYRKNKFDTYGKRSSIGNKFVRLLNSVFYRLMAFLFGIISNIVFFFACIFSLGLPYGVYCVFKTLERVSDGIALENIEHSSYIIPWCVVPILLIVVYRPLRMIYEHFWLKY